MHRSFRHWNWFSSHSLTAPVRHGAAPGSAGRARTAGASRGRLTARTTRARHREPPAEAGGSGWARQGTAARCGAGAGLAEAQRLGAGLGETRLRGSTAAIPKLLCAEIKGAIPVLPRIVLTAEGKGAWEWKMVKREIQQTKKNYKAQRCWDLLRIRYRGKPRRHLGTRGGTRTAAVPGKGT